MRDMKESATKVAPALPLVSAVITTHDRPEYLKLAVQSVLNQTYENIELIVVNDNSGPETIDYLNALQDQNTRVRHIYIGPEETRGGNYARNKGIYAARGKYVAFLDDDDEWLPEKTARQVALFRDGVAFIYCAMYNEHIDGPDNVWREVADIEDEYVGDLSQKCFKKIFTTTSMMMVDRELLIQVGGFDESLRFWQETELCIRLCQLTNVDAVREPMGIRRINNVDPQRLSNKYDGWVEAVDQINRKHQDLIDQLPEDYKKDRALLILNDRIMRCELCGRRREQRRLLHKRWTITRRPQDYVKYLLNIPNVEKVVKGWLRRRGR